MTKLEASLQRFAAAEIRIQYQIERSETFKNIERVAVLTETALAVEENTVQAVPRGLWIQHPLGFYVRYLPANYSLTQLQIYVPRAATDASTEQPLIFDPTEELATPANTYSQRLGITDKDDDHP